MSVIGPTGAQGGIGPQGVTGTQGPIGPTGDQGTQGPRGGPLFVTQNPTIWQGAPPTTIEDAVNRLSMIIYGRSIQLDRLPMTSVDTKVIVDTNPQGGNDAFVTKYTTSGDVRWAARIGGAGDDQGRAVSVDGTGNVYVTGLYNSNPVTIFNANGTSFGTLSTSGSGDVYIVKYNTNGICQWTTRMAGTLNEFAFGISADESGNVYIIGRYLSNPVTIFNANGTTFGTLANSGGSDVFLVKYNTNGVCQWGARIGGGGTDEPSDISVDATGNVYLTGVYNSNPVTFFNVDGTAFGTLAPSGDLDIFVTKYNTNGVCQWATRMGGTGNEQTRGISVDATGNVYTTGFYNSNPFTIFNGNGTTFGTLANSGSFDCFIVKHNTDGVCQWATRIGEAVYDEGRGISVDTAGNVYVTGLYNSNPVTIFNVGGTTFGTLANSGGSDVFLVKYNTDGLAQWATRLAGTLNDDARDISSDAAGNIFVTFANLSTPCTIFNADGSTFGTIVGDGIVKYDTNGQAMWFVRTPLILDGVSADPSTNVYTIGTVGATNRLIVRGAGLQP